MVSSPVSKIPSTSPVSRSPLGRTLDAIQGSLGRFQATLDAARVRRAELAPFPSPAAIALALDASSSLPAEERYALVAVLAEEHASDPTGPALWSSLLLVAFRPLLLRARTQLGRAEDPERDARVVTAFLDALARLDADRVGLYAAAALQRATLKALVRGRAADRQAAADAPFDEAVHTRCEPHALTLGDARADLAWADARAEKLAAIPRWRTRRAAAASEPFSVASASLSQPQFTHDATSQGASP